jgi:hypothetical protein
VPKGPHIVNSFALRRRYLHVADGGTGPRPPRRTEYGEGQDVYRDLNDNLAITRR